MEVKRIFDLLDWLLENYPKDDIINGKYNGKWVNFSTEDYKKYSMVFACGLHKLGLRKGDKIATISNNRPEFNIMDMAMSMLGIIHVPVYPTLNSDSYQYIINHCDAKMVVVGTKQIYAKVSPILPNLSLEYGCYTLDKIDGATQLMEIFHLGIAARKELLPEIEKIKETISENDLATFIYTSGTTGTPKGVMLTHKNLVFNFIGHSKAQPLDHTTRILSFLPLCHVYERSLNYHYQYLGVSIYYAESLGTIASDLAATKAQGFCCVPRILEMFYDKFYAAGKDFKGIKKWIYFAAIKHGQRYDYHKNIWFQFVNKIYDRLVYRHWRAKMGGQPYYVIVSGGSAIQPRIVKLFSAAKIGVYEGYGLSETSPVIAVNNPQEHACKIGTVGPILPGIDVKLAEDGEILTKGPCLMQGYYKDPAYTAEVIDEEGYFHTGDIGTFVDDIYLKITDRKKEIFKLSAGKYIAPQLLENLFKESPIIENIMVIGENEKFASALIAPNFNQLHTWASKNKIDYRDNVDLINHPTIFELFQKEVAKFNKTLSPHEQIKNFRLVTEEWTDKNNFLAPTLKLKRAVIYKFYQDTIDEIYNKKKSEENVSFNVKQDVPDFRFDVRNVILRYLTKNNTIQLHDKVFKKYIDEDDIQTAIKKVAQKIDNDYKDDIPILLNILEGSIPFTADLMNYLTIPVELCSMKCSSYQGTKSTQTVNISLGINKDISGRRVIIVEDIVDTGLTIKTLTEYLKDFNVKDIRIATMTFKRKAYKEKIPIDYIAFEIENKFVVGHGLDYNQLGRNLKHIYQLDESNAK